MPPGTAIALHLGPIPGVAEDGLHGNHASIEDFLVVVDIVDERVQRAHALLEAGIQRRPFFGRNHARHDVERDQALRPLFLAVNRERDADAVEGALWPHPASGRCGPRAGPLQPVGECTVRGAPCTRLGATHLVVGRGRTQQYFSSDGQDLLAVSQAIAGPRRKTPAIAASLASCRTDAKGASCPTLGRAWRTIIEHLFVHGRSLYNSVAGRFDPRLGAMVKSRLLSGFAGD